MGQAECVVYEGAVRTTRADVFKGYRVGYRGSEGVEIVTKRVDVRGSGGNFAPDLVRFGVVWHGLGAKKGTPW